MTNINHNFDNNSAEEVPFGELSETESNQVNDADSDSDSDSDSDRAQVSQSQCQETQRIKKEPTSFGMANASLVAPFDLYDYDPLAEFQNVEMSEEVANSAIKLAGSEIITEFEKSNSKIRIIVTSLVKLNVAEALKIPHSRLVERFTIPESARKYCYELIQTALNEKLLGLQDYSLPASHSRELERLKSDEDKVRVYTIENEKTKAFLQSIADPTKIVIAGKMQQSKKGNYCVATMFNIHLFKHFKSVTLVSAFMEYTMLYHLLDRYYNMVNVTSRFNLTRNLDHRFSSLVLMPLTEQNYSKYYRDRTRFFPADEREFYVDYCQDNKKHYCDAITFPDFVYMVVSGCDTFDVDCTLMVNNLDDGLPKVGIKISAMSHGINIYQDKDSIAYAAAFKA